MIGRSSLYLLGFGRVEVESRGAVPAFWSIVRKAESRTGFSRATKGRNDAEKGSTAGISVSDQPISGLYEVGPAVQATSKVIRVQGTGHIAGTVNNKVKRRD